MFTQMSWAGDIVRTVRTYGVHTEVSGRGEGKDSKDSRCSHKGLGRGRE